MINPVNPYQAFPFFAAEYSEADQYPLLCPTSVFPPICIKVTGTSLTASWKIKDMETGALTTVNSSLISEFETDQGETYIIYEGGAHGLSLSEKRYQLQITVGGSTYYSHTFIPCEGFDTVSDSTVIIDDTDLGLGVNEWAMDLAFNDTTGPGKRVLYFRVSASDSWRRIGVNTGIVTSDNVPGSGTVSFEVRGVVFLGDTQIERIYGASINSGDPLNNFSLVLKSTKTTGLDNNICIEWSNTNDLQPYSLYYQGSFVNRLYIKAFKGFPANIAEESFTRNGENELILDSVSNSEQIPIEATPISEFLFLSLKAARNHDTVKIVNAVDGTSQTVRQYSFNFTPNIDNEVPVGEITYERNFAFVAGCQENETIV